MQLFGYSFSRKSLSTMAGKSLTKATGIKELISEKTKHQPIMLISEYGDLLNVKPMTKLKPVPAQGAKEDLRQVYMVSDN